MKYKNINLQLQSGDIILYRNEFQISRPITWLATLIRWILGTQYNHCGMVVFNWGQPFISESLGDGVITRPLQQHLERSKSSILVLRSTGCMMEKSLCIRANSMLGVRYDKASLVFHQLWFQISGRWIGHTRHFALQAMTCSEFVAWCHNLDSWWLYTPKHLLKSDRFKILFIEA